MNYQDWYTDRLDVYRVQNIQDGALTIQRRVEVAEGIPCRIYRSGTHSPKMTADAAYSSDEDKLSCGNEADIRAGDELMIRRGGGLGAANRPIRAFAGEPVHFYEPFGAVIPGLAHQEITLLRKEYLKGEVWDG